MTPPSTNSAVSDRELMFLYKCLEGLDHREEAPDIHVVRVLSSPNHYTDAGDSPKTCFVKSTIAWHRFCVQLQEFHLIVHEELASVQVAFIEATARRLFKINSPIITTASMRKLVESMQRRRKIHIEKHKGQPLSGIKNGLNRTLIMCVDKADDFNRTGTTVRKLYKIYSPSEVQWMWRLVSSVLIAEGWNKPGDGMNELWAYNFRMIGLATPENGLVAWQKRGGVTRSVKETCQWISEGLRELNEKFPKLKIWTLEQEDNPAPTRLTPKPGQGGPRKALSEGSSFASTEHVFSGKRKRTDDGPLNEEGGDAYLASKIPRASGQTHVRRRSTGGASQAKRPSALPKYITAPTVFGAARFPVDAAAKGPTSNTKVETRRVYVSPPKTNLAFMNKFGAGKKSSLPVAPRRAGPSPYH